MTDAKIWVYDRQDHWRSRVETALRRGGFEVASTGVVDSLTSESGCQPELLILSCLQANEAEGLIARLKDRFPTILVLAPRLSMKESRQLFLAGATDVEDRLRFLEPNPLQQAVLQSLAARLRRQSQIEPSPVMAIG